MLEVSLGRSRWSSGKGQKPRSPSGIRFQGAPGLGGISAPSTHLSPLPGPLLGAAGASLLGVQRPNEGANGCATHQVNRDPRLL